MPFLQFTLELQQTPYPAHSQLQWFLLGFQDSQVLPRCLWGHCGTKKKPSKCSFPFYPCLPQGPGASSPFRKPVVYQLIPGVSRSPSFCKDHWPTLGHISTIFSVTGMYSVEIKGPLGTFRGATLLLMTSAFVEFSPT